MASAFEGVVRSVVRELDHSGELIPVSSLRSSTSFQPYYLLGRRSKSSWFWKARYTCVNLSIRDILEPSAPEPDVERVGPFHFQDSLDGQLQGSVELAAPGQGKLAGSAAVSGSSSASMNVCMLRVSPNTWVTMLQERHLRQPEHKILQQLRSRGDNVFVVTEVLQTQKEVEVTRTHQQEGSGQFSLPGASCFQGQGKGYRSRKKTVTIPSGSILAFRVAQLVVTSSAWDILLLPDKKQKTFVVTPPAEEAQGPLHPDSSSTIRALVERFKRIGDGPADDMFWRPEGFEGLQAEVRAWVEDLEGFSKVLCAQLLQNLGQVLRDQPALQALEEALEQGRCCGQVESLPGPVGAILECLVKPSRALVGELADPIFYLLDALAALSETQHELLAEALESGAMLEHLSLVKSLLEQSTPWKEHKAMSLPPELLGSNWGSGVPAWALLEECGLELQVGAPQVRWDPKAQDCTCALYACLSLLLSLSLLSHPSCPEDALAALQEGRAHAHLPRAALRRQEPRGPEVGEGQ